MKIAELGQYCATFGSDLEICAVTTQAGSSKRMRVVKTGPHNPALTTDGNAPIELFVDPEGTQPALTVGGLTVALPGPLPESDVRVAMPTGEGHHRILAIYGVGFGEGGPTVLELTVESLDSPRYIIRNDPE